MPQGIKPASAIFQQEVKNVLRDIPFCKNYYNDVIITGKNRQEHLNNLQLVLERARKFGLKFNLEKCKFLQAEVKHLGLIINKYGSSKNPSKIEAIINAPAPKNVQEV